MEQIPYDLEVQVRKISVERLLTQYWNPEPVRRPANFVLIMERCGPALQGFRKQMHI